MASISHILWKGISMITRYDNFMDDSAKIAYGYQH